MRASRIKLDLALINDVKKKKTIIQAGILPAADTGVSGRVRKARIKLNDN